MTKFFVVSAPRAERLRDGKVAAPIFREIGQVLAKLEVIRVEKTCKNVFGEV